MNWLNNLINYINWIVRWTVVGVGTLVIGGVILLILGGQITIPQIVGNAIQAYHDVEVYTTPAVDAMHGYADRVNNPTVMAILFADALVTLGLCWLMMYRKYPAVARFTAQAWKEAVFVAGEARKGAIWIVARATRRRNGNPVVIDGEIVGQPVDEINDRP